MENFTTYCATVNVLVSTEALNIERACNIIEALNNSVSLFASFGVKAVCKNEFLLALTQVVTQIQIISPRYTQFLNELGLKCCKGTTLVNTVCNLLHPNVDYEDTNVNAEDERALASELHFFICNRPQTRNS